MHIITPYDPWAPKKKKKTWQEELWEQQQIAEIEAKMLAEASSRTLPPNSPDIAAATAGPAINAPAGAGGAPIVHWFSSQNAGSVTSINFAIVPSAMGTAPFTAQFQNLSSPDALNFWTWIWNFNDGTAGSTDRDPLHTFANTGSYNIALTGSSPNGTVVTQSVRVAYASASRPNLPITVAFTPTQTTGSVPLTVSFLNLTPNYSATNANTYKWIFSGSTTPVTPVTTSALTNPSITFYNTGSYSIKLETTGSWDVTGSAYYLLAVSASHPTLAASFTVRNGSGAAPKLVGFDNTTTYTGAGNLQVTWSYGSGSVASTMVLSSPNYQGDPADLTYINAGNYTASLQITESAYGLRSETTRSFQLA